MAALAAQNVVRSGLSPSYAAATGGGDTMPVGSSVFLHIKNGGGSSITVTLAVNQTQILAVSGLTVSNLAVVVTNGQERMIGPIVSPYFADATTGLCNITYTGVTTVTVGVFNLQG